MMRNTRWAVLGGVGMLVATAWAAPAAAQALTCSAATLGQQACQAENICKCAYSPGGTMTNQPPGFFWQCDIIYGKCPPDVSHQILMSTPGGPIGVAGAAGAGNRVRAAQGALQAMGYNPGPVDGVMGPRTATAIRAFQRAQRLPETGTLTPETLQRLRVG
jgi:hypothetical protein